MNLSVSWRDNLRILHLAITAVFLLSIPAFAQKGGDKKRTVIDFSDELVEGKVDKPELLYLLQKKQFNFKRLIKLRENFLPEMEATSETIDRAGGEWRVEASSVFKNLS